MEAPRGIIVRSCGWLNLILALVVSNGLVFGHRVGLEFTWPQGTVRVMSPALMWPWVVATPLLALAAFLLDRRPRWGGTAWLNGLALLNWGAWLAVWIAHFLAGKPEIQGG